MAISPRSFLPSACRRRELRHRAARRRLRRLAAGVRVDLGVEHQDVDVAAGGEHVVEAAEADVVGPAVAADDPDALRTSASASSASRRARRIRSRRAETRLRARRPRAPLRCDACLVLLVGRADACRRGRRQLVDRARRAAPARAVCWSSARRMPRPNSALSSNSEFAHAGPRPSALTPMAWSAGCRRRSRSSRWRSRRGCGRRTAGSAASGTGSRRSRRTRRRTRTAARSSCEPLTVSASTSVRSGSGSPGRSPSAALRVEVLVLRRHVDATGASPISLLRAGQTSTQMPQPVQSSGATWIVMRMPGLLARLAIPCP